MSRVDACSRRPGYGWVVVAVCFLAQVLAIGLVSYGFGVVVKPLATEFGLSRADANAGLMLVLVGMALASVPVGRLLDRVPGRFVLAGGALLFGIGAAGIRWLEPLWAVAGAALVLAAGASALGPLTAATITSRWFDAGRGRALGVVSVSSSLGGVLTLPLLAWLVETQGWRAGVGLLGLVLMVLVGGLALWLVRERPRTEPAGAATGVVASAPPAWTAARLLRTRDFWLLVLTVGLLMGIDQALLATLVPYGTDRGFGLQESTLLVSAVSLSAIAGKLTMGFLVERFDLRWLVAGVVLLTETFVLVLLAGPAYPLLLANCLLAGAAIGAITPLWAALIGARFGLLSYGTVMGLMIPLQMPLGLLALRGIGEVFDRTGGYESGFAAFAVLLPVAALAAVPVRVGAARATG